MRAPTPISRLPPPPHAMRPDPRPLLSVNKTTYDRGGMRAIHYILGTKRYIGYQERSFTAKPGQLRLNRTLSAIK